MRRKNRRKRHHHLIAVDRSYRNTKFKIFIAIFDMALCFIIGTIFYAFAFDKLIWSMKEKLFSSTSTMIFVSSSAMLYTVQFWLSVALLWFALMWLSFYLLNKTKLRSSVTKYTDSIGTKKFSICLSSICLCLILISFVSYCRIDSNGVYIRGFRTFFSEKHYNWSQVNNVEINSYRTRSFRGSKGTNYSYEIHFGNHKVDITSNSRLLQKDKAIFKVHEIIKKEGIPVYKNIEYEYEGIKNFLENIGEQ